MNPEDDDREPIDVLYDIEEKVKDCGTADPLGQLQPRLGIDPDSVRWDVLEYVKNNPRCTVEDCKEAAGSSASRTLTTLYYSYMINRSGSRRRYVYTITSLGERVLSNPGGEQQNTTNQGVDAVGKTEPDPWEWYDDMRRVDYHALRALRDTDGHPTTKDMNDLYLEYSDATPQEGTTAVSARMSDLYKSEYVDRTPDRPYVYWLTDKGKDVLEE